MRILSELQLPQPVARTTLSSALRVYNLLCRAVVRILREKHVKGLEREGKLTIINV